MLKNEIKNKLNKLKKDAVIISVHTIYGIYCEYSQFITNHPKNDYIRLEIREMNIKYDNITAITSNF